MKHIGCSESDIPEKARFDVPRRHQGQIVEVAYAAWPPSRYEADSGDTFMRVKDTSDRSVAYYRKTRR